MVRVAVLKFAGAFAAGFLLQLKNLRSLSSS